ncbi:hypothetical protein ACFTXJ_00680 [Streptomyces zhihengii]|uniref:hypothetical protein n=1 Tax=Streptomyces zhihengii TaxID=1818004 RepID=UPI0036335FA5
MTRERLGGKQALAELAVAHLSVTKISGDGGHQTSVIQHGAGLGIDVEVVHDRKRRASRRSPSGE